MAVRKKASATTVAEQNRYLNVVTQLINGPGNRYGNLVAVHADMSHNMHGGMGQIGEQRFLSWHRVSLLRMEEMMQAIDPLCFIPYWKFTAQREIPPWIANFMPVVNVPGVGPIQVRRNPGPPPPLPSLNSVLQTMGNTTYTSFTSDLEDDHNSVHGWVGRTMNNISISSADPIFWLVHAAIDRLWSIWQSSHPGLNPTLSGVNRTMDPWPETAVGVRDIAALGYSYGP